MWLPVLGLILGLAIGYISPFSVPVDYAKYLSVAILAALDSVLGGIRSVQEENFDSTVFLTGFFSNMLLASLLAYVGDRIGVDLYLAAVVAFGVRLFQNMAIIRRHLLKK
jgi:small basic protein